MSHVLRAVLLQPEAEIILLLDGGSGELTGGVLEQLRRAGEISLYRTGLPLPR